MDKEHILCAAIWYKEFELAVHSVINIDKGIVLCGHRHPHIIGQCISLLNKRQFEMGENVQGFLTNKNRFVDRKEAGLIAYEAGQTSKLINRLHSEDLY